MSKKKNTNKAGIISDKRTYSEIVASLPENYSKPYESPFAKDARPHIYVYDANKPEGAIVSLTLISISNLPVLPLLSVAIYIIFF